MAKQRSVGVAILGWLAFLLALVNLGIYIFIILAMGIRWQIEVFARFVRGNPQALSLIWTNYSPLVFGILLIYIGRFLLKKTSLTFIKNVTVTYLVLSIVFLFVSISSIIMTFYNIVYFILLLIVINRPELKEQFK
jgi:hypothetical protein